MSMNHDWFWSATRQKLRLFIAKISYVWRSGKKSSSPWKGSAATGKGGNLLSKKSFTRTAQFHFHKGQSQEIFLTMCNEEQVEMRSKSYAWSSDVQDLHEKEAKYEKHFLLPAWALHPVIRNKVVHQEWGKNREKELFHDASMQGLLQTAWKENTKKQTLYSELLCSQGSWWLYR